MTTEYTTIHEWSEVKLEIIKKYATAYSKILNKQQSLQHIYIDAFSGSGFHRSAATKELVPGSPLIALSVEPPFKEYHFIDVDIDKTNRLSTLIGDRKNIFIYNEDCNVALKEKVLKRAKYEEFKRALCLLDPYAINLDWDVVQTIGNMKSVDIFINFMIMDMNRNVFRKNIEKVADSQIQRMNIFWGDDSWKEIVYRPAKQQNLFGDEELKKDARNDDIAEAYKKRLLEKTQFRYIAQPLPMNNSNNTTVYYLIFASYNKTARDIAESIFKKYRA